MTANRNAASGSRETILASLREQTIPASELPSLAELRDRSLQYDDPWKQFQEVLTSVGGNSAMARDADQLASCLKTLPCVSSAKTIVCGLPNVSLDASHASILDADSLDHPRELAHVDVAIFAGQFAVAENAAVWIDDQTIRHRAIFFIAQHVVLVVPHAQCLHNMHEAYDRLSFRDRSYGLFISGPSKTADIEQSLVIGAHGPRSLTVVVLES